MLFVVLFRNMSVMGRITLSQDVQVLVLGMDKSVRFHSKEKLGLLIKVRLLIS